MPAPLRILAALLTLLAAGTAAAAERQLAIKDSFGQEPANGVADRQYLQIGPAALAFTNAQFAAMASDLPMYAHRATLAIMSGYDMTRGSRDFGGRAGPGLTLIHVGSSGDMISQRYVGPMLGPRNRYYELLEFVVSAVDGRRWVGYVARDWKGYAPHGTEAALKPVVLVHVDPAKLRPDPHLRYVTRYDDPNPALVEFRPQDLPPVTFLGLMDGEKRSLQIVPAPSSAEYDAMASVRKALAGG
ncbi:MAG TPA: hypothetical protein VEH84_16555 [Alphaproteobacteria bacterium]|nr:hypothetical protein [Alphaproteobacteria bacterium]